MAAGDVAPPRAGTFTVRNQLAVHCPSYDDGVAGNQPITASRLMAKKGAAVGARRHVLRCTPAREHGIPPTEDGPIIRTAFGVIP